MADLSVEQLRARVSGDMPLLSELQCLVGSVLALVQGQMHTEKPQEDLNVAHGLGGVHEQEGHEIGAALARL